MRNYYLKFLTVVICMSLYQTLEAQCTGTPTGFTIVPLSQTICAGTQATMMVTTASNTSGVVYQWQSSTISAVGPFSNISGATAMSYTSVPLYNTIWFNVIITCNNSQQSISLSSAVTVSNCAPPCSGQPATTAIVPASNTLCAGDVASLSLTTTYTDTGIGYQWGASPSSTGAFTAIPNATLNSYTSGSLSTTMYYNVTVTCANSSLSTVATNTTTVVSCTYCAGMPGSNTVVPVNHTICAGMATTMSLTNSYTATGITYQWQSSTISPVGPFISITGATLNMYSTPVLNQTTYYNVIITCTNSGQSISVPHMVTVVSCTTPCTGTPASTSVVPASHTICAGDNPAMSLSAFYPYAGLTYQWSSSSVQAGPYNAITGATLSSFTDAALFANKFYSVVVTCTNSQASTSATHSVAVINCSYCAGTPAGDTILPAWPILCHSASYTLHLANTYTATGYKFQWASSNTSTIGPYAPITGATQNTLAIQVNPSTPAHYQVVITCTNSGKAYTTTRSYKILGCSGIDENEFEQAKVYPNPVTDYLVIQTMSVSIELTLTDLSGRLLLMRKVNDNKMEVNLQEYPPGIYLAKIKHQGREEVIKITKQ